MTSTVSLLYLLVLAQEIIRSIEQNYFEFYICKKQQQGKVITKRKLDYKKASVFKS